jgi:hypothetical protein
MEIMPYLDGRIVYLYHYLFSMLGKVSEHSSFTLMDASNLSIVWTPNFLKGDMILLATSGGIENYKSIVKACIENHKSIFI